MLRNRSDLVGVGLWQRCILELKQQLTVCPSPGRKLKCCLTSSCSKINQSAPLIIDPVLQYLLQPASR